MRRVVCLAVLALGSAGCPDRSISKDDPVPAAVFSKEIPVSVDLDILFVIDDSSSMTPLQAHLTVVYVIEPAPTPTEKTARNSVTTTSSLPRTNRT